ncbi:hypothetical protein OUZ56_027518 [Daphnia magna]|uniref:Secreted protein n=1 Tax=Daphnia magna TaxID=35525 RepID=A0ABQ9ZQ02_9CRUS|nr:hypothetical protein OUZ56_027518 [Daphnia magna]
MIHIRCWTITLRVVASMFFVCYQLALKHSGGEQLPKKKKERKKTLGTTGWTSIQTDVLWLNWLHSI